MAPEILVLVSVFALGLGLAAGYGLRVLLVRRRLASLETQAAKVLKQAKAKAQEIILQARQKAVDILEQARQEERKRQKQLELSQERLSQKEMALEERAAKLERFSEQLKAQTAELEKRQTQLVQLEKERLHRLEQVAALSQEEARAQLLEEVEQSYAQEIAARLRDLEKQGREQIEQKARRLIALAMERLASTQSAENTTYTVSLASDELKGRIIGKEGRNIRTFEKEAGVELIIDDTPEVVVISSFSPIRREVARIALERLIRDGRIQPARIEKYLADARAQVAEEIRTSGEEAVYKLGIVGVDPNLIKLLGRLKFRTSYGQNVLEHSIEVARLAEMLASELGADSALAKRAGLFHDIGKAVDHEIQGSHVEIGRKILKKFGESEEVIKAMQAHHGEYEAETVEAVIVGVADAISGARPGARRASLAEYLQRLEDLEAIAKSFKGVQKTYAIQAGRELRIFVEPENVSDDQAKLLARKVAASIEEQLKYPGEIKVHVIRESRVIEYAR